jgi:hypothetical protein
VPYAVDGDDGDDGDDGASDDEDDLPVGSSPGVEAPWCVVDEGSSFGSPVAPAPPVQATIRTRRGAERMESL